MELLIIHRRNSAAFPEAWENYAVWRTCLREVALLPASQKEKIPEGYEVLSQEAAISSLVEICSGLHSPILGETEVFGQFRARFLSFTHSDPAFQKAVRDFTGQVLEYTKRVRDRFLKGGNVNSYGSFTRKLCKGLGPVSLLGSGQLAEEILPWLSHMPIEIHARNLDKATALLTKVPKAKVASLTAAPNGNVLIVAAPLSAEEILYWSQGKSFQLVIDLRGESRQDPLPASLAKQLVPLEECFQALQATEQKRHAIQADTRKLLNQLLARARSRVECRPFGWEDVCA